MAKAYGLTAKTAARVRQLVNERPGNTGPSLPSTGGPRPTNHVRILSGESPTYIGEVLAWDESAGDWSVYSQVTVYEVADRSLAAGGIYDCVRYGQTAEGSWVYMATALGGSLDDSEGCEQIILENGTLKIQANKLIPDEASGLEVDGGEGCGKLKVKAACGIEVTDDGVSVKVADLAGGETKGIIVEESEEGCGTLKVAVCDCNVELTSCGVRVKTSGLVAEDGGLEVDASECGKLKLVDPGCGLYLDGNAALNVDVDGIAGGETTGIIAVDGDGCTHLEVAVCPCNMEKTSCGIRVKTTGLVAEGGGLEVDDSECGKLKIKTDCHLTIEDAEFGSGLSVDVASLIDGSLGLEVKDGEGEGEEATCPTLEVKCDPCNMELSSEGIRAKVSEMVEEDGGLKVEDEDGCGKISVDYDTVASKLVEDSCGLTAEAGVIKFEPSQAAGEGLVAGEGCKLDVLPGCGIKIEDNAVTFDAENAAGKYLEHEGCKLKVKLSCGLEEGSGGGIAVKAGDIAGTYLEPEDGCKIRLAGTIKTIKIPDPDWDGVLTWDMSGVTLDCETGALSGTATATVPLVDQRVYVPYEDEEEDGESWWCVGSPETVPSCIQGTEDDASAAAAAIDPVTGTYGGPYGSEADCTGGCV